MTLCDTLEQQPTKLETIMRHPKSQMTETSTDVVVVVRNDSNIWRD